jgi:hypothetical protein
MPIYRKRTVKAAAGRPFLPPMGTPAVCRHGKFTTHQENCSSIRVLATIRIAKRAGCGTMIPPRSVFSGMSGQ